MTVVIVEDQEVLIPEFFAPILFNQSDSDQSLIFPTIERLDLEGSIWKGNTVMTS